MSTTPDLEPCVLRQAEAPDAAALAAALQDAFVAMRAAVGAGRPIVAVIRDDDLLGQRTPEAAALAAGLLGMVRALAMEGASRGWQVNAVSHREGDGRLEETVRWLGSESGLTGQLLRVTADHLGKVWP